MDVIKYQLMAWRLDKPRLSSAEMGEREEEAVQHTGAVQIEDKKHFLEIFFLEIDLHLIEGIQLNCIR